ncbi:MAG: hypothetical protein V1874_09340 [Spirochaetota bacterium]
MFSYISKIIFKILKLSVDITLVVRDCLKMSININKINSNSIMMGKSESSKGIDRNAKTSEFDRLDCDSKGHANKVKINNYHNNKESDIIQMTGYIG